MSDTIENFTYDRRTNYILSSDIYIYPSSQSDDGGDVNIEKNIKDIRNKIVYKNFVVRKESNKNDVPPPLEVIKLSQVSVKVAAGQVIVGGYFIDIKDEVVINIKDNLVTRDFMRYNSVSPEGGYASLYDRYKYIREHSSMMYINVEEVMSSMKNESLYLVIELLMNNSGNINGDYTQRVSDTTIRVNHGVSFRVYTGEELVNYNKENILVLCQIIPKKMETRDPDEFEIYEVINSPDKYMYIDWDNIVTENNMTLKNRIINMLSRNDRIVCYDENNKRKISESVVSLPDQSIGLPERFEFIRYHPTTNPPSYDENGNVVVEPYSWADVLATGLYGYEKSYIIDMIHRRSHVSSSSDIDYYEDEEHGAIGDHTNDYNDETYNSTVSYFVDSRDVGEGRHEMYPESYTVGDTKKFLVVDPEVIKNDNGTSRLIARADHNHGFRYIFSGLSLKDPQYNQTIKTGLVIEGNLILSNENAIQNEVSPGYNFVIGASNHVNSISNFILGNLNTIDSYVDDPLVIVGNSNVIDHLNGPSLFVGDGLKSVTNSQGSQIVVGQYNSPLVYSGASFSSRGRIVVGGGNSDSSRDNIFSVDEEGNTYVGGTLKVSGEYIESSSTRFYISNSEPSGSIVEGSLGIGWDGVNIKKYVNGSWT